MAKLNRKIKRSRIRSAKRKTNSRSRDFSPQQEIFQQALELHQKGRLQQAEALYRRILAVEPEHSDTLHYLGLLAYQAGSNESAVELLNKALKIRPDYTDAHNNLGIVLNDLGRLAEATESFRRALALKPDYVEVHFNLANVLRDQDKLAEAVDAYHRALSLRGEYPEAYNNLGTVFYKQGKPEKAADCFRRALTLKPDYVEAHYNLANSLNDLGKMDEAAASFQQALDLKPDYLEAQIQLGAILKEQGKLTAAADCFRRILTLRPDFAEMHYNLGVIYRESGKLEDAAACYRKALSLKPGYAAAFKDLTSVVRYKQSDNLVESAEKLFRSGKDIPAEDRIALGFGLGKVYEDLGDFDKAIAFLAEANRLQRDSYGYSISGDQDFMTRVKGTFSSDFFAAHSGSGYGDRTPIFILGMPRSGTTLVEQILASHPLVFGAGELNILTNLTGQICTAGSEGRFPECILDLDGTDLEQAGEKYIERLRRYSGDAQYITDKMPYNFLYVGLIRAILPDARVIHCTRNPMDNCFSLYKNYFKETHGYAYDMVELGGYYKLYLDLMAHWENVLPEFMYTVRYEELVADQREQTEKLLDFCGLPWNDACMAFYKTARMVSTASLAQVRQPIYKDSVKLWQRYEKQLGPLKKTLDG